MLSHTRNRQSRWIKVATAPMAKAKAKAKSTQSRTRSQTHSNSRYVADEKWHVKRDKSLINRSNRKLDKQNHVFHQHSNL